MQMKSRAWDVSGKKDDIHERVCKSDYCQNLLRNEYYEEMRKITENIEIKGDLI